MPGKLLRGVSKAAGAFLTREVRMVCDGIPYRFRGVPWKKLLNWALVEGSVLLKPERPWGWPTHMMFEPSNHCNLACTICPVTDGMDRPRGHMSPDLFKRVIESAPAVRPVLSLHACAVDIYGNGQKNNDKSQDRNYQHVHESFPCEHERYQKEDGN